MTIGPSTGAASTDEGRGWTIRFLALSEPKQIKASVGTKEWDVKPQKVNNGIVVQVGKVLPNTKAAISLGSNPELSHNDVQGFVRPILADAQIQFKLKEDIWQIVSAQVSGTLKASRLHVLGMDENLRDAVLEYVLAE